MFYKVYLRGGCIIVSSGLIPTELTREQRRVIWGEYFSRHADLGTKCTQVGV